MATYLLGDFVKSGVSRRIEKVSAARIAIVILRGNYKVPLMIPTEEVFTQTFTKSMDYHILQQFLADLIAEGVPEDYISLIMAYDKSDPYWGTSSMFIKSFHERLGREFNSRIELREAQIEAASWIEENLL